MVGSSSDGWDCLKRYLSSSLVSKLAALSARMASIEFGGGGGGGSWPWSASGTGAGSASEGEFCSESSLEDTLAEYVEAVGLWAAGDALLLGDVGRSDSSRPIRARASASSISSSSFGTCCRS